MGGISTERVRTPSDKKSHPCRMGSTSPTIPRDKNKRPAKIRSKRNIMFLPYQMNGAGAIDV
jgi:hypothetical protein